MHESFLSAFCSRNKCYLTSIYQAACLVLLTRQMHTELRRFEGMYLTTYYLNTTNVHPICMSIQRSAGHVTR